MESSIVWVSPDRVLVNRSIPVYTLLTLSRDKLVDMARLLMSPEYLGTVFGWMRADRLHVVQKPVRDGYQYVIEYCRVCEGAD